VTLTKPREHIDIPKYGTQCQSSLTSNAAEVSNVFGYYSRIKASALLAFIGITS